MAKKRGGHARSRTKVQGILPRDAKRRASSPANEAPEAGEARFSQSLPPRRKRRLCASLDRPRKGADDPESYSRPGQARAKSLNPTKPRPEDDEGGPAADWTRERKENKREDCPFTNGPTSPSLRPKVSELRKREQTVRSSPGRARFLPPVRSGSSASGMSYEDSGCTACGAFFFCTDECLRKLTPLSYRVYRQIDTP